MKPPSQDELTAIGIALALRAETAHRLTRARSRWTDTARIDGVSNESEPTTWRAAARPAGDSPPGEQP